MHPEAALPSRRLEAGTTLTQAEPWAGTPVTLAAPALAVLTDLRRVKAATGAPSLRLAAAEQAMIYMGVRMLFVVDAMPVVLGLVGSHDLRGERPMRVVQQRGVRHDEITVADVMHPLAALDAVELDALATARVSNVVATLRALGRDHLPVVERSGGARPIIVGVFSRRQIERQLGKPIEMVEVAGSFAEIRAALG